MNVLTFPKLSRFLAAIWVGAGLLVTPSWSEEEVKAPEKELSAEDREVIRKLIEDLDSDDFRIREGAGVALVEFGSAAVEPLEEALAKGIGFEAELRAKRALEQISVNEVLKNPVELNAIFEEARLANEGDLNSERLQLLLERLVVLMRKSTDNDSLFLPVTFDEVKAGERGRNELIVGDRVRVTSLSNSIVLAETAAEFTSARDSIIISRGTVKITGARNCIVLAADGSQTTSITGGITLSGGSTNATSVKDAIVGASDSTKFTSVRGNSVIVNSPPNERASRFGIPEKEVKALILPPASSEFE